MKITGGTRLPPRTARVRLTRRAAPSDHALDTVLYRQKISQVKNSYRVRQTGKRAPKLGAQMRGGAEERQGGAARRGGRVRRGRPSQII